MAEFAVILPAAGKSTRMTGFQKKKPFVDLKGRPVWLRTAELFMNRPDVSQTILVISPDDLDWFREAYKANLAFSDVRLVAGGATRADSVRNGLAAITGQPDFVAVHDAARPLMTSQWIDQVFAAVQKYNAVIPGVRITSTVKKVDDAGTIVQTIDRSNLVQAQTPQVFQRELLIRAYAQNPRASDATDDASLVESAGHPVHVIDGWPMNIKITTTEDFRLAELYLSALPRPGGLNALHPFADDRFA